MLRWQSQERSFRPTLRILWKTNTHRQAHTPSIIYRFILLIASESRNVGTSECYGLITSVIKRNLTCFKWTPLIWTIWWRLSMLFPLYFIGSRKSMAHCSKADDHKVARSKTAISTSAPVPTSISASTSVSTSVPTGSSNSQYSHPANAGSSWLYWFPPWGINS